MLFLSYIYSVVNKTKDMTLTDTISQKNVKAKIDACKNALLEANTTVIDFQNDSYTGFEYHIYNSAFEIGCEMDYNVIAESGDYNYSSEYIEVSEIENITFEVDGYEIELSTKDKRDLKALILKSLEVYTY